MRREHEKTGRSCRLGPVGFALAMALSGTGCLLLSDLDPETVVVEDAQDDGSGVADTIDATDEPFAAEVSDGEDAPSDIADVTDVADVARPTWNACGGVEALTWDGEERLPGRSCGPFDDGILVCNGREAMTCILASEPNECGGPGELVTPLGQPCGCAGVTVCSDDADGSVTCADTVQKNACGGCAPLQGRPGFFCETAATTGRYVCLTLDDLICVGGAGNACGGDGALEVGGVVTEGVFPGDACISDTCGPGSYVCDGADGLRCQPDRPCNTCGGTRSLAGRRGQPCGLCADGVWACETADLVICEGATPPNSCGGCSVLTAAPGTECEVEGGGDIANGVTLCRDGGTVCSALSTPDAGVTAPVLNDCGGTRELLVPAGLPGAGEPATLGEPCGACAAGELVCDGANAVRCTVPEAEQRNVCGGCTAITARPNTLCGTCGSGRLQCDTAAGPSQNNRLVCQGDLGAEGRNACGGCGILPGVVNNPCGTCLAWACDDTRLECAPLTDGPECDGVLACTDLTCEDDNRACVETDGIVDAVCGACASGFIDDGAGACRTVVDCDALACGDELRQCEPEVLGDGLGVEAQDAACTECIAGAADDGGVCRVLDTCESLGCAGAGRDCVEADTGTSTDAACGDCIAGLFDDEGECRSPVDCETLSCEATFQACAEGGAGEDAVCGECLDDYIDDGLGCRPVETCLRRDCDTRNRECIEATADTDAECGECLGGFVDEDGTCRQLETCASLEPACGAGRECIEATTTEDAACGECLPELVDDAGTCRSPITCAALDCAALNRACEPDSPGVDAICSDCVEGYNDLGDRCELVNCGGLSAPDNGLVDVTDTTFESIATYECAEGYDLVGDMVRSCSAAGAWTGAAPVCVLVDCGALTAPENGQVDVGDTTFGAVRTFSCDSGYTLQGAESVECTAFGTWSSEPPFCARSLAERCITNAECGAGAWCPTDTLPELRRCSPRLDLGDGVTMEFVFVPAGTFEQGTPGATNEERPYTATITRNYWVSRTEVTQGQWRAAMDAWNAVPSGSRTMLGWTGATPAFGTMPSCYQTSSGTSCAAGTTHASGPVELVSWWDAVVFANVLSRQERVQECYTLSGCGTGTEEAGVGGGCTGVSNFCTGGTFSCTDVTFAGPSCAGYRLLTESEWERAARGGTTTTYYWGSATDTATVGQYAWFSGNAGSRTQVVGAKLPNAYGLYDMSGNVLEWVWDWVYDNATWIMYQGGSAEDYVGGASGSQRGYRGGSWGFSASSLRAADRSRNGPTDRLGDTGLRLARTAPTPSDSICPIIPSPVNGRIAISSQFEGATATYACDDRYQLAGTATRTCESGGTWSGEAPTCNSATLGEACTSDTDCNNDEWCPTDTLPELRRCSPRVFEGEAYEMDFMFVPAGTFEQGTPGATDNERPYTATITRDYWVSRTEVTQGQWRAVMEAWNALPSGSRTMEGWAGPTPMFGTTPSCFQTSSGTACATGTTHASGPVERVSWWDAVVYANVLSRLEGVQECYTLSGCGTDTGVAGVGGGCSDTTSVCGSGLFSCAGVTFVGPSCTGYRLLTESEWERAARGGTTSTYYWGSATDTATVGQYAWLIGTAGDRTQAVGGKLPNAYGLYDMSGNVREWVWDWVYSGSSWIPYPSVSATDYLGGASGSSRGLRGGSWNFSAFNSRSVFRDRNLPNARRDNLGLRLARTVP